MLEFSSRERTSNKTFNRVVWLKIFIFEQMENGYVLAEAPSRTSKNRMVPLDTGIMKRRATISGGVFVVGRRT